MNWRPLRRDDRQIAWLWTACALSFLGLRPLWVAGAALAPRCVWHAMTGVACPGCGATRALLNLLQGRFVAALAVNPLAAVGAIAFVALGAAAPVWLAAGGRIPVISPAPKPVWLAAFASAVAANWAWLVASGV